MSNSKPDSELTDAELADRYFKQNHDAAVHEKYGLRKDEEMIADGAKLEEITNGGRVQTQDGRSLMALPKDECDAYIAKEISFGVMMYPLPPEEIPKDLLGSIPEGHTVATSLPLLRFKMPSGDEHMIAVSMEMLQAIGGFAATINPGMMESKMEEAIKDLLTEQGGA